MFSIRSIFSAPKNLGFRFCSMVSQKQPQPKKEDELFKKLELEIRGHDPEVMRSYLIFVKSACKHLEIESSKVIAHPYIKWIQYALRSKFAKKKYKLHYETRTHIRRMFVYELTGSTARTFLEYIQRNIPEGVAMKVTYEQITRFPFSLQ